MPASCNPPWAAGLAPRRQRGNVSPSMRVSDAERTEVSDRLSRHYADGRLDQAEFDERLSRAMSARTHGDFAGLFDDLPDLPGQTGQTGQPGVEALALATAAGGGSRSPFYRIAVLALIIVGAVAISRVVVHSFVPWLLIALVAYLLLRGRPGHRHRI